MIEAVSSSGLKFSENGRQKEELVTPRGDGHPIMIFPGFNRSDEHLRTLGERLNEAGYLYIPSGVVNDNPHKNVLEFRAKAEEVFQRTGMRITAIGESLGGIIGLPFVLWHQHLFRPEFIGLGTPFAKNIKEATASRIAQQAFVKIPIDEALSNFLKGVPGASIPHDFRLVSIHGVVDRVFSQDACFDERAEENISVEGVGHFKYLTDSKVFSEIRRVLLYFQSPLDK